MNDISKEIILRLTESKTDIILLIAALILALAYECLQIVSVASMQPSFAGFKAAIVLRIFVPLCLVIGAFMISCRAWHAQYGEAFIAKGMIFYAGAAYLIIRACMFLLRVFSTNDDSIRTVSRVLNHRWHLALDCGKAAEVVSLYLLIACAALI